MILHYAHRDPMLMTWCVYEDHIRRVIPFLIKFTAGKATEADVDKLRTPLLLPKET